MCETDDFDDLALCLTVLMIMFDLRLRIRGLLETGTKKTRAGFGFLTVLHPSYFKERWARAINRAHFS